MSEEFWSIVLVVGACLLAGFIVLAIKSAPVTIRATNPQAHPGILYGIGVGLAMGTWLSVRAVPRQFAIGLAAAFIIFGIALASWDRRRREQEKEQDGNT